MRTILCPSFLNFSANVMQRKRVAPTLLCVVTVNPNGGVYPVLFEIDDGGYSIHRDEIDPDDLTDYGYRRRNQVKKSWIPPGYGDDD